MIRGKPSKYTCGVAHCGPALECALQSLLGRVAQVGYVPQARAASFGFVRDSSDAQLANSLAHHAEKLALADLVCHWLGLGLGLGFGLATPNPHPNPNPNPNPNQVCHECDVLDISVSIKARHASAPRPRRTPLRPRDP